MKGIRLIGLLLLIGMSLLNLCCSPSSVTIGKEPDIRGDITMINPSDKQGRTRDVLGTILIEGAVEKDTKFDKASVTVKDNTRIFKREGESYRPVAFDYLKVGQRVQARFTGPVLESYPVQTTASEIVVLK